MIGGVYIAYPIDQRGPASLVYLFDQIEAFKSMLMSTGRVKWIFDPGDAFLVNPDAETDDTLPLINRAAHVQADLIVAFLPAGIPTLGVPVEIDRGLSQGKHVMVFSDATNSWMLDKRRCWIANGWEDEHLKQGMEYAVNLEPRPQSPHYMDLRVKVGEQGNLPTRQYDDDAGFDLYVSEDVTVHPGEFADIPCGVSAELPQGTWGLITGRSSALRARGLLIHSGVIDGGYRGPLFAGAWNMTSQPVRVRQGERVAQLIVMYNTTRRVTPLRVDELSHSPRGERGFGSSGT